MSENYNKKFHLKEIIDKLKQARKYFSYADIKTLLEKEEINITPSSLKSYVFELVKNKVIFDAGKGWYSSIEKPFELNTKPVQEIIKVIKGKLPLLPFSSTNYLHLNEKGGNG